MTQLHKKSITKLLADKPAPSGKPVKPNKPVPAQEQSAKIPVACSVLTEERVREIAREEVLKREMEKLETKLTQ